MPAFRRVFQAFALCITLCITLNGVLQGALAQQPVYEISRASADGIGKRYMGREIAAVMGWQGASWLESLIRASAILNIKPVLGKVDQVNLAKASIDLAIMVDVYHELEFPYEMLSSIIASLKPGGQLVLVEYRAEDPRVPIKEVHKMSEAQVRKELAVHTELSWERTGKTLPWQHVIVFRKRT
jgi:SAM-dependent methyltransferase